MIQDETFENRNVPDRENEKEGGTYVQNDGDKHAETMGQLEEKISIHSLDAQKKKTQWIANKTMSSVVQESEDRKTPVIVISLASESSFVASKPSRPPPSPPPQRVLVGAGQSISSESSSPTMDEKADTEEALKQAWASEIAKVDTENEKIPVDKDTYDRGQDFIKKFYARLNQAEMRMQDRTSPDSERSRGHQNEEELEKQEDLSSTYEALVEARRLKLVLARAKTEPGGAGTQLDTSLSDRTGILPLNARGRESSSKINAELINDVPQNSAKVLAGPLVISSTQKPDETTTAVVEYFSHDENKTTVSAAKASVPEFALTDLKKSHTMPHIKQGSIIEGTLGDTKNSDLHKTDKFVSFAESAKSNSAIKKIRKDNLSSSEVNEIKNLTNNDLVSGEIISTGSPDMVTGNVIDLETSVDNVLSLDGTNVPSRDKTLPTEDLSKHPEIPSASEAITQMEPLLGPLNRNEPNLLMLKMEKSTLYLVRNERNLMESNVRESYKDEIKSLEAYDEDFNGIDPDVKNDMDSAQQTAGKSDITPPREESPKAMESFEVPHNIIFYEDMGPYTEYKVRRVRKQGKANLRMLHMFIGALRQFGTTVDESVRRVSVPEASVTMDGRAHAHTASQAPVAVEGTTLTPLAWPGCPSVKHHQIDSSFQTSIVSNEISFIILNNVVKIYCRKILKKKMFNFELRSGFLLIYRHGAGISAGKLMTKNVLMAKHKAVVTPFLKHWGHRCLTLSHH